MNSKDELIHVKFEFSEGVAAKKRILSSEIILLKIQKTIQRYRAIRIKEMQLKILLKKVMKELTLSLTELEKTLPKSEIPKLIKHEENETNYSSGNSGLESELKDIQNRLRNLG